MISLDKLALVFPSRELKQKNWSLAVWFLCCIYDIDTSWLFNQKPATVHQPFSHTSELMATGRDHDFDTMCNYCKRSIVFVQTDICEWGFVKVIRLISIKLVSIQYFDQCVQGFCYHGEGKTGHFKLCENMMVENRQNITYFCKSTALHIQKWINFLKAWITQSNICRCNCNFWRRRNRRGKMIRLHIIPVQTHSIAVL